jgi:SOS-response transcriptional repressor LexA
MEKVLKKFYRKINNVKLTTKNPKFKNNKIAVDLL